MPQRSSYRSKSRTARRVPRRSRRSNCRSRKSIIRSRRSIRQRGGAVVLPSDYFGVASPKGTYSGKFGESSFPSAYGPTKNNSRGNFTTASAAKGFTCANIAPGCGFSDTCKAVTQTGGSRKRRSRSSSRRRQKTYTKLRIPKRRRQRQQRGGGGSYGRTVLPQKYFGCTTEAFTSPPGCQTFKTAYGPSEATQYSSMSGGFLRQNLAPGGQTKNTATSGIPTGG